MIMDIIAIIVAAGRGLRLNSAIPKQYIKLAGISSLERSIMALQDLVDGVLVVIHPDDIRLYQEIASKYQLIPYVFGGILRQDSVRNGLEHIAQYKPKKVLIHDAARPFTSKQVITNIISELDHNAAVIAASKAVDTIKMVKERKVISTLDREQLYLVQTPQGFNYDTILAAHRNIT
jgi:2-C-methyl-D-erythritol 4-phosphate cytidylyltransferase